MTSARPEAESQKRAGQSLAQRGDASVIMLDKYYHLNGTDRGDGRVHRANAKVDGALDDFVRHCLSGFYHARSNLRQLEAVHDLTNDWGYPMQGLALSSPVPSGA